MNDFDRRRERERAAREKAEVNPAARRDRPGDAPGRAREREREAEKSQVPGTQEEPLDPLGPGGIGD